MLTDAPGLIQEFLADVQAQLGVSPDLAGISNDCWTAPHQAKDLLAGCGAVYVFSLSSSSRSPAGAGRVLKVGKAGSNSNPRFRYQHYAPGSTTSTLAGAIVNNPLLWRYIGYSGTGTDIATWIRENTDRDNFYFNDPQLVGLFEVYAKARLGPAFEGSLSSNKPDV
jgi:hypothetical protein